MIGWDHPDTVRYYEAFDRRQPFTMDYRIRHHSGEYRWMLDNRPELAISTAVEGMLPKNRLGRELHTKLKVYKGSTHPHAAQKPEVLTITG